MTTERSSLSSPTTIGSRITRLEDEPLLRGRGRFVDDIALPGVWHAAFVRSPHPHALIKSVDKTAALAVPGVHAVLTLDDLAKVMVDAPHGAAFQLRHAARQGLAVRARRRRGRPTSASRWRWCWRTTATSPRTPRRWSTVDYEPLPFVADVRTAKDSAPIRRELTTNVITTYKVAFGDVDAAFAKAAHVFKQELWQHRGAAHSIEARGLLAELRQTDGGITVHASTQKAHDLAADADLADGLRPEPPRRRPRHRRRLRRQALRLFRGRRRDGGGEATQPLDQVDRGPPRIFHQRGARARPVLGAGDRGRCRRQGARRARQAPARHRRLHASRTRTFPTTRPRP